MWVVCIEKLIGVGNFVEVMGEKENLFYVIIGFKVECGEFNCGIIYKLGVEFGLLFLVFYKVIEDMVF